MMEEIRCPHCRAGIVMDSAQRGQGAHCPWCQESFQVPAVEGAQPEPVVPSVTSTPEMPQTSISFSDIPSMPTTPAIFEPEPPPPVRAPQDILAEPEVPPEPKIQPISATPEEPDFSMPPPPKPTPVPPPIAPPPPPIFRGYPPPPPPPPSAPPPRPSSLAPSKHAGYDLTEAPVNAEGVRDDKPSSPPTPPPAAPPTSRTTMPCPLCQGPILVTPELRGRHVICPHCRRGLTVPWTSPSRSATYPSAGSSGGMIRPSTQANTLPQGCVVAILVTIALFLFFVAMRGCS